MKRQITQAKKITLFSVLFLIQVLSSVALGQSDKCIQVVDGDTIKITFQGVIEKVRLIGVDTPEIYHPNKSVEYFAEESSSFTRSLVEGKEVTLEFDWQRRDKYGRLLAYVYLADGTMVNKKIIEEGYGHAYTKYPFKYAEEFIKAEKSAREKEIGLWGPKLRKEEDKNKDLDKTIVYVTDTGKKYHCESCQCLTYSKNPIKLEDAIKRGYKPCRICKPPVIIK